MTDAGTTSSSVSFMVALASSAAGYLHRRAGDLSPGHAARMTGTQCAGSDAEDGQHFPPVTESIQMRPVRSTSVAASQSHGQDHEEFRTPSESRNIPSLSLETSSNSGTPSMHLPFTLRQLMAFPTAGLQAYLRRLRRAHDDAAKTEALSRAERREQNSALPMEGDSYALPQDERLATMKIIRARKAKRRGHAETLTTRGDGIGWGLGKFGINEHREGEARLKAARNQAQEDRLISPMNAEADRGRSICPVGELPSNGTKEGEWEDVDDSTSSGGDGGRDQAERSDARRRKPPDRTDGSGSGWSWWGPLKDWRLSDRSVY